MVVRFADADADQPAKAEDIESGDTAAAAAGAPSATAGCSCRSCTRVAPQRLWCFGGASRRRCNGPRARGGPRDAAYFKAHGYSKPVGLDHGGAFSHVWSMVTFNWIAPLLALGARGGIEEQSASPFVPEADDAAVLARQFERQYKECQEKHAKGRNGRPPNLLFRTLLALHWVDMWWHFFWTAAEVAVRLLAPVLLRGLLTWLRAPDKSSVGGVGKGWMWAVLFGLTGYALTLIHHQLFWYGMRMGFRARQQAMAAVQAKVLRLNSAAIADVTSGKVVNLVSNDVRRFDDAGPFWVFLFLSPIELCCVVLMVSLELGAAPAFAGVAALLALIPVQATLSRLIGKLRAQTATFTDERVRLEGEAVGGALAMKMLGWEQSLLESIGRVRKQEAAIIAKMNRIRATNMALQFAILPLASFITFSVVWAQGKTLQISSVFYSLALLQLPQLYMATFFTRGVETVSELRVSIKRLDAFLALPEPPPPSHLSADGATAKPGTVEMRGADFDWRDRGWAQATDQRAARAAEMLIEKPGGLSKTGSAAQLAPAGQNAGSKEGGSGHEGGSRHDGGVADSNRSLASSGGGSTRGSRRQLAAASDSNDAAADVAGPGDATPNTFPQLAGLRFSLQRGELLGICGEVGAGKSSILAALLGELQPIGSSGASGKSQAGSGPLVAGRVAYCCQVPWVVAGSVQDNITFGLPLEPQRYQDVIRVCALADDIASLPAGDATELGERGINLSGGQKARLALARAAYAQPDVALLDDPLSAVDPRVGRVLFEQCIGPKGLLNGSTRVLVTHQRQYLPACDRLLVLRGGRVAAAGTWAELSGLGLSELHIPAEAELDDEAYDANMRRQVSVDECLPEQDAAAEDRSTAAAALPAEPSADQQEGSRTSKLNGHAVDEHIPANGHAADGSRRESNSLAETSGRGVHRNYSVGRGLGGREPQDSSGASASFSGGLRRLGSKLRPGSSLSGSGSGRLGSAGANSGGGSFSLARFKSFARRRRARESDFGAMRGDVGAAPDGSIIEERAADEEEAEEAGSSSDFSNSEDREGEKHAADGALVAVEHRATGGLGGRVYAEFGRYMGVLKVALLAACMVVGQGVFLTSQYWLAIWASRTPSVQREKKWEYSYAIFSGSVMIISLFRSFLFFHSALSAGTRMHNAMAQRVLHAPLRFFHTNPTGRIVNRFSKDQGIVDEWLPQVLFDALQSSFMVFGALVLVAIAVPFVIPFFVPLLFVFWFVRRRYVTTSREVKRWEGTTRSPVYSSFSAAVKGLPTIRAYGAGDRFRASFLEELDLNCSWWFGYIATARWVGFRLDLVAAVTLMVAAYMAMALRNKVSVRLVGLALSYTLQLSGLLQWATRQTAEAENDMTSVERVLQYTHLPQEPARVADGAPAPPKGWPGTGSIEFQGVWCRYRPGLPPVLSDLSFVVEGGSSCGVVGRTGSGKSSLMLALFRLIDVTRGRVLIDGIDASSIGLDALRSQLAIIPQDPVLFSGTLRSNLDPGGAHSEARIAAALTSAQLTAAVAAAGGLDASMAEAGDNLSVGQRQLFCLARALLQDARILALDEATANVDRTTDALIQQALRAAVRGEGPGGHRRTLMVIAHRVDTIMDCDGLLVLDRGRLVEAGRPGELSQRPGGTFARLVAAAEAARQ